MLAGKSQVANQLLLLGVETCAISAVAIIQQSRQRPDVFGARVRLVETFPDRLDFRHGAQIMDKNHIQICTGRIGPPSIAEDLRQGAFQVIDGVKTLRAVAEASQVLFRISTLSPTQHGLAGQEDLATPPFVISRLTGLQMEFPKGFTEIHLAWAVRVRGIKIVDAQIERLQNDL